MMNIVYVIYALSLSSDDRSLGSNKAETKQNKTIYDMISCEI